MNIYVFFFKSLIAAMLIANTTAQLRQQQFHPMLNLDHWEDGAEVIHMSNTEQRIEKLKTGVSSNCIQN